MKKLLLKVTVLLALLSVALFVLSGFSEEINHFSSSVVSPRVRSLYALVGSLTPLPLFELAVILFVLALPFLTVRFIRGRGTLYSPLILLLLFVFGYMMTVAIPSVTETTPYAPTEHSDNASALIKVAERLEQGSDVPFDIDIDTLGRVCDVYMADVMHRPSQRATRVKYSILSPLLSRLGIFAYYSPMTAELILNKDAPVEIAVASSLHELAHYYGITSEDRAALYSYMIADSSDSNTLKYYLNLYAFSQIGAAVVGSSKEDYYKIYNDLSTRVKNDLLKRQSFVDKNKANKTSTAINDAAIRLRDSRGGGAYCDSLYALVAYINGSKS